MSNLQLGLVVLGGLILAAVVAHGAWSARRVSPRQADPLVEGEAPPTTMPGPAGWPQEPSLDLHELGGELDPTAPILKRAPSADKRLGLDALIDVIAPIALEVPVSGDAVLAALPPSRRAGTKVFAVEGFNEALGLWEAPTPGARYAQLQAGVQLASRTGALNDIEFSEFVVKTQAFCDVVGGAPDFPDMLEQVARARELDQFASKHDAQLSFTLRARNAAWSPGYVLQHAARLGFVAGALPGRMVLSSATPGHPPLVVLSFDSLAALAEDPSQSPLRDLLLALDVPQVDRAEQPYARMRVAAQQLAKEMDGLVCDDHGQTLTEATLDAIGTDLEALYDTLETRDLAAGSPQARRLFS